MTDYTASKIAAKWWADKLRSGQKPSRKSTRTLSELGPLETAYTQSMGQSSDFTEQQIATFESDLAAVIRSEMQGNEVVVDVDYNAGDILNEARTISNMPNLDEYLPWKTIMWVEFGKVVVKEGYGAPVVVLWEQAVQS